MGVGYSPEPKEIYFHKLNYENKEAIQGLLRFYWHFKADAYKKFNTELICILVDLEDAIKNCGLSDMQKKVLKLYMDGWTQIDIGRKLGGIRQQTVLTYIDRICKKISRYLTGKKQPIAS